jgi:hypothetical protein
LIARIRGIDDDLIAAAFAFGRCSLWRQFVVGNGVGGIAMPAYDIHVSASHLNYGIRALLNE